eukprot:TRINITY_DN17606_c0_g2_i1.p1 TRINITY_DN17606_c0_g2~~TRINITY_DN17606_c0_g2_i1.p1  ORF type:complete len:221 (+),score=44.10 TRINITY_DN17606_c0_g2_i1:85-747(+)
MSGEAATDGDEIRFEPYRDERDMPGVVALIEKDLSEPYSVFTYRYFINNWPDLCYLTMQGEKCVGAIVCKLDVHRCRKTNRGYIAMLAVDKELRGKKIGSKLVHLCLDRMRELGADECVLETEITNKGALGLYRSIGFVKEKRLHKYYLNGNDAFRMKYLFKLPDGFSQGQGCLGPPVEEWSCAEATQKKIEAAAGSAAAEKKEKPREEKEKQEAGYPSN